MSLLKNLKNRHMLKDALTTVAAVKYSLQYLQNLQMVSERLTVVATEKYL